MKKLNFILFAALLFISLNTIALSSINADENHPSSVENIKKRGVIKIGVFSDKPPFGYVDEKGLNQGFDVIIAKAIAKSLLGDENKVEYVLVEAANRVEYLRSGKLDLILANFTVTPERVEVVDFTRPYMKVSLGIVSPKNKTITKIEELNGKTLIVVKGTTAELYFTKNHPEIKLLKFDQNTEAFQALRDGRGEALSHDNGIVFGWANNNPEYSVEISDIGSVDYIAPAVKKGNTSLANWLNNEMKNLADNGVLRKAYNEALVNAYGEKVKPEDIIVEEYTVE